MMYIPPLGGRIVLTDSSINFFERLATNAQTAASQLCVSSALNPMLWLCGIASLPCFIFSIIVARLLPSADFLLMTFLLMGSLPIIGAFFGFFYLAIFCPQRLQSEDYQIKRETLEVIKQKGSALEVLPSSLEAITNPAYKASSLGGGAQ
jgi:hypothetical protein